MEFLTRTWIDALTAAAAARVAPDPDPIASVTLSIDQVVDGVAWRTEIDNGTVRVTSIDPDEPLGDSMVRLTMTRDTAVAIAENRRSVLDAFVRGDLRVGGDVSVLLQHQRALAEIDDLFSSVRAQLES